jgi:hypothetical protein
MSRAFVREDENDKSELPDRPISAHRNFVTEAGLAAIEAALGRFEAAHRAAADKSDREATAAALREVLESAARERRSRQTSCRQKHRIFRHDH